MKNPKILVIDDEEDIRTFFKIALGEEGYSVFTAGSAEKGIVAAKDKKPDVVLIDLIMPGLNGIEGLKRLKNTGIRMEVILITGQGSIETAKEAMKLGAYDFITKPIDLDILNKTIIGALTQKVGRREKTIPLKNNL